MISISQQPGMSGIGFGMGMDPISQVLSMLGMMQPQQAGNFMGNLANGAGLQNDPTMNSIVAKCNSGEPLNAGDKNFLNQNANSLTGGNNVQQALDGSR
ncbi:MAG TPA: hypothetical protein VGU61_02290 [Noviherbaspirillum sp.]|jgi:hypothetical protein|uniref:hypothetical protein n=1 Tax=Noviherbaspirillum sp. TaxID=1926288 RepID=UPI002DDD4773|nr:hypothetical protein [Noviherbaspirillum sp.]HEV2609071.1 hypothetical protein [Noviherbaspirillum sp.]